MRLGHNVSRDEHWSPDHSSIFSGRKSIYAGRYRDVFCHAIGRAPNPTYRQYGSAALVGLLMIVGGNGLVLLSIKNGLPSGIAAVIVATMPLWMTLFDWLFYHGPRPTGQILMGLFIGMLGIVLLVDPLGPGVGESKISVISALTCLAAPMFWSLGSLQSRKMDLPKNVFMSVAVQMFCGGVAFLLISLITGECRTIPWSKITLNSALAVLYLSIFGSIIALTTYMWLLKNAPASRVATYTYVNPIIAVFLGWMILSEMITIKILLGIAIIVAAVVLIVSQKPKTELKTGSGLKMSAAKCR